MVWEVLGSSKKGSGRLRDECQGSGRGFNNLKKNFFGIF
jgi:hypothetical protein